MNEIELESLKIRIFGDGQPYEEALKHAQEATNRFVESVVNLAEAYGIERLMHSSLEKWESFESLHRRLGAVLEANGRDVAHVTEEYEGYAAALSKVSVLSKGQVLNLLQTAEGYRVTGAQANQAVKEAAALAAITGHSAESMLRLTTAMASGDFRAVEHSKRLVNELKNLRDPAEIAAQYARLVAAGTKVMGQEAEDGSGKIEKLKQAWGGVQVKLGQVVSEGMKPWLDHALRVAELSKTLPPEFYEWAAAIGAATIALLTMGPALKLLSVTLSPVRTLIAGLFDVAMTVASTVAWVAWTAVVAVAKGVVWLYNASILATNVLLALFSAKTLIAQGAVWLLDAALGVLNVETLVPLILTFGVLAGAVVAVGTAMYAAYKSARTLIEVFSNLSLSPQTLGRVTDLFNEWKDTLGGIVDVAMLDLPAAWDLLVLAGQVAQSEIKDLWPPLWQFVVDGWGIASKAAADVFEKEFTRAAFNVSVKVLQVAESMVPILGGGFSAKLEKMRGAVNRATDEMNAYAADNTRKRLQALLDNLELPESAATEALKEKLKAAIDESWQESFWKDFWDKFDKSASKPPTPPHFDVNLTPKFDSAEWNSAEMRTRVDQWKDRVGLGNGLGSSQMGEALRRQKDALYDPTKDQDYIKRLREEQTAKYNTRDDVGGGTFDKVNPQVFYEIKDVLKDIRKQNESAPKIVSGEMSEGVF